MAVEVNRRSFLKSVPLSLAAALGSLAPASRVNAPQVDQRALAQGEDAKFKKDFTDQAVKFVRSFITSDPKGIRDGVLNLNKLVVDFVKSSPSSQAAVQRANLVADTTMSSIPTFGALQVSLFNRVYENVFGYIEPEIIKANQRPVQAGDYESYLLSKMGLFTNHTLMSGISRYKDAPPGFFDITGSLKRRYGVEKFKLFIPTKDMKIEDIRLSDCKPLTKLFSPEQLDIQSPLYITDDPSFTALGVTLLGEDFSQAVVSDRSAATEYDLFYAKHLDKVFGEDGKKLYLQSNRTNELFHIASNKSFGSVMPGEDDEILSDIASAQDMLYPYLFRLMMNEQVQLAEEEVRIGDPSPPVLTALLQTIGVEGVDFYSTVVALVMEGDNIDPQAVFRIQWKALNKALRKKGMSIEQFDKEMKAELISLGKKILSKYNNNPKEPDKLPLLMPRREAPAPKPEDDGLDVIRPRVEWLEDDYFCTSRDNNAKQYAVNSSRNVPERNMKLLTRAIEAADNLFGSSPKVKTAVV